MEHNSPLPKRGLLLPKSAVWRGGGSNITVEKPDIYYLSQEIKVNILIVYPLDMM